MVLGLVVFGLIMVYSSSFIYAQERTGDGFSFIKKQVVFAVIGLAGMVGLSFADYRKLKRFAYPLLIAAVLLVGAVYIPGIGVKSGGAQRWLDLGILSFQPSELAKFVVIIFLAALLERKKHRIERFTAGVVSPYLLLSPLLVLLLFQPDFGSVVMICAVTFLLISLAGVPLRYLGGTLLLGGAIAGFLILSEPYRKARLLAFLDPWSDPSGKGFQILQSLVGLHNGHFWGAGLGNGKEKLFYLPEAHNDFILAVIGEELGFVGISLLALTFLLLIYRGLKLAWQSFDEKKDLFACYLAAGISLTIGLQAFVNMGVVFGMLPTKGLTLPFVSYGGSALVVDLCAVGILLSITRVNGKVSKNA